VGREVTENLIPLSDEPALHDIPAVGGQRVEISGTDRLVLDEARAFQHLEVLTYSRSTDRKELRDITDGSGARMKDLDDLAARPVAERVECDVG
jgi:hypothetical protein